MSPRPVVYLHIGLMKTGTTYLQRLMIANRDALEKAGWRLPGRNWASQVAATQDLLGLNRNDPGVVARSEGAWDDLVRDILAWRGRGSVVSMEFLSFGRGSQVDRVPETLGDAEVHVIATVRDAVGVIPAQWQTSVVSGATYSWPEFLRGVRRTTGPRKLLGVLTLDAAAEELRRTEDLPAILETWLRVVPPERLHVVTVPRDTRDQRELWRRFAGVIGIDPDLATEEPSQSNPSLGMASTELVRLLNLELGEVLPWDRNRTVKRPLAERVLGERRGVESRARLDTKTFEFALDWNERCRDAITETGVRLVGSLDDLPVDRAVAAAAARGIRDEPELPGPAEVLAAADTAYDGLVATIAQRYRQMKRRGLPVPEVSPAQAWKRREVPWRGAVPAAAASDDLVAAASDELVAAAVKDLAEMTRIAIRQRAEMRDFPH